jgi:hypothetical protein
VLKEGASYPSVVGERTDYWRLVEALEKLTTLAATRVAEEMLSLSAVVQQISRWCTIVVARRSCVLVSLVVCVACATHVERS